MPIDLIALLQAVGGLSGLLTSTAEIIKRVQVKHDEDEDKVSKVDNNLSAMKDKLAKIREIGQSLNDYKDLLEVSNHLSASSDRLYQALEQILQIQERQIRDPNTLRFIHSQVDSSFRDCRTIYNQDLTNFPRRAKKLDERDQGVLDLTTRRIESSLGAIDALINQDQINYSNMRLRVRDMNFAAVDIQGISRGKIELITQSLMDLGGST